MTIHLGELRSMVLYLVYIALTNHEITDFADDKIIFSYGIYCMLLVQNSSFVCFELLLFCFLGGQDAVTVVGYPLGGDTISVTKGVVSRIEV